MKSAAPQSVVRAVHAHPSKPPPPLPCHPNMAASASQPTSATLASHPNVAPLHPNFRAPLPKSLGGRKHFSTKLLTADGMRLTGPPLHLGGGGREGEEEGGSWHGAMKRFKPSQGTVRPVLASLLLACCMLRL